MDKIICIGSASKDIFFPTDEGVITDTPDDLTSQRKITFELGAKYQVDNRYEAPGGVAANVAQGLARLGIKAGCYSKIGNDQLGRWIKDELKKENVDTTFLQVEKDCQSDLSAIIVNISDGERTIFFNRDANEKLEIIPRKIRRAEWIFVSALNGSTEKSWDKNLEEIMSTASENKLRVALNPGQRNIQDNPEKIIKAIKNSTVVILNKDEAIDIIGSRKENSAEEKLNDEKFLIQELKNFGPEVIALTDGLNGSWAYDGKRMLYVGTSGNKPIETTGAGDAFLSGFLAAYIKGKSMEDALKWGTANGGNVVKFYGAKKGLLNEENILKEIVNMKVEAVSI